LENKQTYLSVFDETPKPSHARRWFWFLFAALFVVFHLFGGELIQLLIAKL